MTSQGIKRPIITTFVNNLNIFAPAESKIMKWIMKRLDSIFNKVNIGSMTFTFV